MHRHCARYGDGDESRTGGDPYFAVALARPLDRNRSGLQLVQIVVHRVPRSVLDISASPRDVGCGAAPDTSTHSFGFPALPYPCPGKLTRCHYLGVKINLISYNVNFLADEFLLSEDIDNSYQLK
jgi:hypothetical protein